MSPDKGNQVERTVTYFEKPGPTNTDTTLRLAAAEAASRNIAKVIVASTRGNTAKRAAKVFAGTGIQLIVVPHMYGFTERQLFSPEVMADLEGQGHKVHFGTMLFHTDKFYGSGAPEAMAMVLRTICQGLKVCVEVTLMAADAGLVVRGEEIIVVTGTGRGADTAVVAIAATSSNMHDLHITEILCKPLQTRSWARGTSPYDPPERRR